MTWNSGQGSIVIHCGFFRMTLSTPALQFWGQFLLYVASVTGLVAVAATLFSALAANEVSGRLQREASEKIAAASVVAESAKAEVGKPARRLPRPTNVPPKLMNERLNSKRSLRSPVRISTHSRTTRSKILVGSILASRNQHAERYLLLDCLRPPDTASAPFQAHLRKSAADPNLPLRACFTRRRIGHAPAFAVHSAAP